MINYELKFLTSDESVNVKNVDLKTCKYETKKKTEDSIYDIGKRTYCERRGGLWRAPRPRLLRELETKVRERNVVFCEWLTETLVVIVFSSGTIAYLTINPDSLDIMQILFDRYCVGKMAGQSVTGVVFSSTHLLFTHNESLATLVTFGPFKNGISTVPFRIADRNPHVQSVELADGARRAERRVSWGEAASGSGGGGVSGSRSGGVSGSGSSGPRVLVWTAAGADPAPWTPAAELRANLHLYQLRGQQMNVVAYHQLENETLLAEVSRTQHNIVHIVEQSICHKNGVSVEWASYSVGAAEEGVVRLGGRRAGGAAARLPAAARAARRAAGQRTLLACLDGSLHVLHHAAGLTHSLRAGFIASEVHWACDAILCVEEGARLHCFDRALAPLQHSAKCLQLAHHVRDNSRMKVLATQNIKGGALLLTAFSSGPIALLRVTHPQLPMGWVRAGRVPRAVALLRAMDWETEGDDCLHAIQSIANSVWRRPLGAGREAALQEALGSFLAPRAPLAPAARKYLPAVVDLARKFTHHLLRRGRYDKALSLAVDLRAWDLFCDARWAAAAAGRPALAEEAQALAEDCFRTGAESVCSGSCSCCSRSRSCSPCGEQARGHTPPPLPRLPPAPPAPSQPAASLHHYLERDPPAPAASLHHYLERDLNIWTTAARDSGKQRPGRWHSMDDVLEDSHARRLNTIEERPSWRKTSDGPPPRAPLLSRVDPNSLYSYRYQNKYLGLTGDSRTIADRGRAGTARPIEKNVKFSDTVTIAVMSHPVPEVQPSPARELADSLPLCAPHAYLAAFEPAGRPAAAAAGTVPPLDYVEV